MDELREWMERNIGGLRDDRSTESYALEFLKTDHANLALAHRRFLLTDWERQNFSVADFCVGEMR